MKQTAVEWLQQALEDTILTHEQIMQTIGLFEQAKEMEKEQIVKAWENGWENDSVRDDEVESAATKYYNETFNTNDDLYKKAIKEIPSRRAKGGTITTSTGSGELINEIKSYVTFNRKENI
jgi:hypothetical protein